MNIHVSGTCAVCLGSGVLEDMVSKNMGKQIECNMCNGQGYYTVKFKATKEFMINMVEDDEEIDVENRRIL